jgi:hypothetical protein
MHQGQKMELIDNFGSIGIHRKRHDRVRPGQEKSRPRIEETLGRAEHAYASST